MILARGRALHNRSIQSIVSRLIKNAVSSMSNTMQNDKNDYIVWMDMEMTGLDINRCHIMEVACLVTDKDLRIVSDELNIVVHQPDSILDKMNDWCKVFHTKSGLTKESRLSKTTIQEAEKIILNFLQKYVPEQKCPLAGNSIYMDRLFVMKYMPLVHEYLHYRIIDVSSIKEVIRRWSVNVPELPKGGAHRALADIKDSIKELEHYKKYAFVQE